MRTFGVRGPAVVLIAAAMALAALVMPIVVGPATAAAEVNLFTWGDNSYASLGTGDKVSTAIPIMVQAADGVLAGATVTAASIAEYHACAVASGAAYCWGYNPDGRVGDGSTTQRLSPVAVSTAGVLAGKTVTDITAGKTHSCAVADGSVYCWGTNSFGELGRAGGASQVPVAVNTSGVLNGKTVVKVRAGRLFTCALTTEPALYCWGFNYFGQLGNNSTTDSAVPVAVNTAGALLGKTVTDFGVSKSGLGYHACAVANGAAYCWGANSTGQLGNNSFTSSSVPVAVDTSGELSGKTVTGIAPGNGFTCAVANGAAYCWGDNSGNGMLGTGGGSTKVPAAVSTAGVLSGKTIAQIAAGPSSACVRTTDDAMACWGATSYVISGGPNSSSTPVAVVTTGSGIVGKRIRAIEFGTTGMLAITASPPAVTSVSPSSGPAAGGTSITITGTDFATSGTVSVTVGGVECGSVDVASSTSISCTTGAGAAGGATVIVTLPDGQTASKESAFTYIAAPSAASVSPTSGPAAGGTPITIAGADFATTGTVSVTVGGVACESVSVVSSMEIACTTPAGTAGAADVVVTNPDGQFDTASAAFTYIAAPSAASVSPTSGPAAGGTPITIAGTDFATTGTVSVTVGGVACESVSVVSSMEITCTTPAGTAGAADVVVTNPDGQFDTVSAAFTYQINVTVTDVSPRSARSSGGTMITVTGSDFAVVGEVSVTVGGTDCADVTVASATSLTCLTPAGAIGPAPIVVTNPGGESASSSLFEYVATTTSAIRYTAPVLIPSATATIELTVTVAPSSCAAGTVTFSRDVAGTGAYADVLGAAEVDAATGVASMAWSRPVPLDSPLIALRAVFDGGDLCSPAVTTAVVVVPPAEAVSAGAAAYSVPGGQRPAMGYVVNAASAAVAGTSALGDIVWEVPSKSRVVGVITEYRVVACPAQKPPIPKTARCAAMAGTGTVSDWDATTSTWVQRSTGAPVRVWVADGGFVKGASGPTRADWFRFDVTSLELVGETAALVSIGADHLTVR